ncbi:polyketide synthase [Aspergillus vadensis CBS 113365]|uniref:Polyketide synthase n=1 Tax=Aspergillus vadensis (strain CBS 113365 / IMI 142717 / IBT 24658) TaxID=1448311 RepID=A0A319CZ22_ASPVC|nr:polyketide synthase [Aspergillus vadensis CBS 113365]PYH73192.1 polyketide synthase [Aspergillus vadensis CBS 113365]
MTVFASSTIQPDQSQPWQEIDRLVEKYSAHPDTVTPVLANAVVLLTGSSGSLGSHCLAQLVQSNQVSQVICVLRNSQSPSPSVSPKAYRQQLQEKKIFLSEAEWSKVTFITCDPTDSHLGLDASEYQDVQRRITHVVHAAWPMDFRPGLSSLCDQFQFLRHLLLLAACGGVRRRFLFVSSIAAVAQRGLTPAHAGELIEEASMVTQQSATGLGYADGKIVCEKILERAAATYPDELEIAIVRGGPIVGSRATGIWTTKEVVPMMLRSSLSLGKLPQLRGTLSWMPVDDAAAVFCEILLAPHPLAPVYQVENPIRQAWSDLLDTVGPVLGLTTRIPFDEWLAAVVEAAETEGSTRRYPVLKLKAFFARLFQPAVCGHVILATDRSRACSPTLRQMRAVEDEVVLKFVQHWKDIGYFA